MNLHHLPSEKFVLIPLSEKKHFFLSLAVLLYFTAIGSIGRAGLLVEFGPKYIFMSAVPQNEERTPNINAFGGDLNLGASYKQKFTFSLYASMAQGNIQGVRGANRGVELDLYGLELGFRAFVHSYFGIRGFKGVFEQQQKAIDSGIPPEGNVVGGTLVFGVVPGANDRKLLENNIQINFELINLFVTSSGSKGGSAIVDGVMLSIKYVYLQKSSRSSTGSLFRAFHF